MDYYAKVISLLKEKPMSKAEIVRIKARVCKEYGIARIPTDIEVLLNATQKDLPLLRHLQTKPVRVLSGVYPIALMTRPESCPHGVCIFCPGGPGSVFGDVPQSYTGKEPSTMRSMRNLYDPYLTVMNRLEQYIVLGNLPQKVDIIIQGGTFPALDDGYQEDFVKGVFQAMDDFSELFFEQGIFQFEKFKAFFDLPGDIHDTERLKNVHAKMHALKSRKNRTLQELQEYNDMHSNVKCIGLTIETKPDWGMLEQGNEILKLGCTRVELGIQSVYDEVLKFTHRGHTLADTKRSIQALKDLGFKLNFHYMPGLPLTTKEMDRKGLKELFENPVYRPDMLKIYPCLVMPGTALEKLYTAGKFKPMSTEEAVELVTEFERSVPEYCRIMRVQRDIPTNRVTAGVDRTNLRQYVDAAMEKKKAKCRCIRCREIGRTKATGEPGIQVKEYEASGGREFFISVDAGDALIGFCRLRFPETFLREEITPTTALVRELHVYGKAEQLGKKGEVQHRGFGKQLMQKAEDIAKEHGKDKVLVISGVGVRQYFRKIGYASEGSYVGKKLR